MEVVLFFVMVVIMVAAVGRVGLELVHSLGIQRADKATDMDALVRKIQRQQVAEWEAKFPNWRAYVIDKLPSDKWPAPCTYGPARKPRTHPGQLVTITSFGSGPKQKCAYCGAVVPQAERRALPGYSDGGVVVGQVLDATGQVFFNRDTGTHLADICGCSLCQGKRAALAIKKSPRGHALLYCNCGDCVNLRQELLH